MIELPAALKALDEFPQFILWKAVPRVGKPGWDKLPVSPHTGEIADAHDPALWVDSVTACAKAAQHGLGVGYVFTANDPFFFLDIDGCEVDGAWSPLALELCNAFAGASVELSHSGRGLHVIAKGAPPPGHANKNTTLKLELYTQKRFVALTGTDCHGDAGTSHTGALGAAVASYFGRSASAVDATEWTHEPVPEWKGTADDAELLRKALASQSGKAAFGGGITFRDLWEANEDALGEAYPDGSGLRVFDHSSADAALCAHLAFWTGKDCDRVDRLYRQSALYREKWERDDYRHRTVTGAAGRCKTVYGANRPDKPDLVATPERLPTPEEVAAGATPSRSGFMFSSQLPEHFAGCIYVRSLDRVFMPDGDLLRRSQFNVAMGGYTFMLDNDNSVKGKNAFDAFTEARHWRAPRAHDICFRPELPAGKMFKEAGRNLVNSYVPAEVPSEPGDVSPFLNFLAVLLPHEHDRAILLAFMASLLQNPGKKFQWSPLLQGVQGNGKTLIVRAMSRAVGDKYTHLPNASELGKGFTGWLGGKLFIGIEEIRVADRWDVMEAIKPLITNERVELHFKGVDQFTGDNRANFIMCSNHKDAIYKGRDDRRFCVFYTGQQDAAHLVRDGIHGDYFPRLYAWCDAGGYAKITHFLRSYDIPDELNPATMCHRPPDTSSTQEALTIGLGPVEQEVLNAVDECRPGFSGGWISSVALDTLIDGKRGLKAPRTKRREILQGLGYDWHPSLPNGKASRVIAIDGGRPTLYVQVGGGLWHAGVDSGQVIAAYEAAQRVGV